MNKITIIVKLIRVKIPNIKYEFPLPLIQINFYSTFNPTSLCCQTLRQPPNLPRRIFFNRILDGNLEKCSK